MSKWDWESAARQWKQNRMQVEARRRQREGKALLATLQALLDKRVA